MQPELTFERGFCRPECVECSLVCPTGAIEKITSADKSAISTGQAVWIKDNCVITTEKLACTACERHCPTKAITLVALEPDNRRSLKIPVVDNSLCIGCGACEYHCPARPFSAMHVEGNVAHHTV
jgi:ferredoxin